MASLSGNNTIVLKGREFSTTHEGQISGTGSPGMNVVLRETASVYGRDFYSAGSSDYVGTGTGVTLSAGALKILMENSLVGETVNDAYADGDDITFHVPKKGDVVQVLVASGETVVKGTGLGTNSAGKFVTDASNPTLEALESSSGSLSADTLVRARVL